MLKIYSVLNLCIKFVSGLGLNANHHLNACNALLLNYIVFVQKSRDKYTCIKILDVWICNLHDYIIVI